MTTIRECVKNPDEFKKLASTRIHWTIRRTPVYATNGGGKVITTFEETLSLLVTSITKEGHIVFLETKYGVAYPSSDEYQQWKNEIRADREREFPDATEGAWLNGE